METRVEFTGVEVALLAGFIAVSLPYLSDDDFEVADLMLDRALAVLPRPLNPDLAILIAQKRSRSR